MSIVAIAPTFNKTTGSAIVHQHAAVVQANCKLAHPLGEIDNIHRFCAIVDCAIAQLCRAIVPPTFYATVHQRTAMFTTDGAGATDDEHAARVR